MILILLKLTVYALVSLAALKGLASFSDTNKLKLVDRLGINLYERNKVAAWFWIALAELIVFRGWIDSMYFYRYNGTYLTSGVTVIMLWVWAVVMSLAIPRLAGMKKIMSWVVAAILMTVTSITVLTLM